MSATLLKSPELDEVEGKLNERREKLHSIFTEAGPEMDMDKVKSLDGDSAAKVEAIRTLNEEIDDYAKQSEDLRTLLKGAQFASDFTDGGVESGGGRTPAGRKSLGQVIAESEAPKVKGVDHRLDFDTKTLMTTSAGWAPETTRGPRLVDFATRPLELLDLIPNTTTDQVAVTFMEETTFTNNAAETAEGAAMPEAALALTERTSPVQKIAVTLPVTDEQLADVSRLQQYIDNRLPFMVYQRLSGQLVAGDGTPPNLRGVLNVSGIQTQAKGADPTPDAVYKAMVKVQTTGQAVPDAFVTNPLDWQDVRLLRTTDGIYIWGSPSDPGPARIWGLPVIQAQAMTQNTGVVGSFQVFSELAVKQGIEVKTGYVGDQFKEGEQTIRATIRVAFVVYRPAAFCSVTGI